MAREYRTITQIAGPLLFVEKTEYVGYGELVEVMTPSGERRRGQVLDSSKDLVVVQVFEGTAGIDRASTVKFLGETIKLGVSKDMLGRILSGAGDPIDGGPPIIPDERRDIVALPSRALLARVKFEEKYDEEMGRAVTMMEEDFRKLEVA